LLTDSTLTVGASGSMTLQTTERATLKGGANADTFDVGGWSGSAAITGGAGADSIVAANDADFVLTDTTLTRTMGPQKSVFTIGGIEGATLTGGAGNNILNAAAFTLGGVTFDGGAGNDKLTGTNKVDVLNGGDDDDTITAKGGNDSLDGGNGTDTLDGGTGTDTGVNGENVSNIP